MHGQLHRQRRRPGRTRARSCRQRSRSTKDSSLRQPQQPLQVRRDCGRNLRSARTCHFRVHQGAGSTTDCSNRRQTRNRLTPTTLVYRHRTRKCNLSTRHRRHPSGRNQKTPVRGWSGRQCYLPNATTIFSCQRNADPTKHISSRCGTEGPGAQRRHR